MIRLAVIFESSPFDRKGLFNAVHNRVKHLLEAGGFELDVYCVHSRDNMFTRHVRHTPVTPDVDKVNIEGVGYSILWYRFSIIDHILLEKFGRRPILFDGFMKRTVSLLEGYDAVLAHSFTGGLLAYEASQTYGMPYFVTWHGSDVHTHPWRVPVILEDTRAIMRNASCNFFVSNALKDFSDRIAEDACKHVLYNGVSDSFIRFPEDARMEARRRFGLANAEKSVSFAGNLAAVKNVRVLAPLFRRISELYDGNLKFLIAGDGRLRAAVESDMASSGIDVRFFGNLSPEEMPAFMNSTDVLVLPSLNEGLPLVCAEALRCGANVVGSDVGGIAEVVGKDNVFPLDSGFVDAAAARAVQMLREVVVQDVPSVFDWSVTASKEAAFLRELEAFRKP